MRIMNRAFSIMIFTIGLLGTLAIDHSADYHLIQVHHRLFAIQKDQVWHLSQSEFYQANNSRIKLHFEGPFSLNMPERAFDRQRLKLAFVARLNTKCTLLVLVNHRLNYTSWAMQENPKFGRSNYYIQRPFTLEAANARNCPRNRFGSKGHLKSLPGVKQLLAASQSTLTSILSNANNSVLYFVACNRYIKLDLVAWKSGAIEPIKLPTSCQKSFALYNDQYLIGVQSGIVCHISSLEKLKISPQKCRAIELIMPNQGSSTEDEMFVHHRFINLLGAHISMSTAAPAATHHNPFMILVILIAVAFILLTVVFIIVDNFFCLDSAARPERRKTLDSGGKILLPNN